MGEKLATYDHLTVTRHSSNISEHTEGNDDGEFMCVCTSLQADRSTKPRLSSAATNSSEDEYLAPVPPPLPTARRFDITLSQLLVCTMPELALRYLLTALAQRPLKWILVRLDTNLIVNRSIVHSALHNVRYQRDVETLVVAQSPSHSPHCLFHY